MALRICLQSPCLAHKALAQLVAALPRYSTFFSPVMMLIHHKLYDSYKLYYCQFGQTRNLWEHKIRDRCEVHYNLTSLRSWLQSRWTYWGFLPPSSSSPDAFSENIKNCWVINWNVNRKLARLIRCETQCYESYSIVTKRAQRPLWRSLILQRFGLPRSLRKGLYSLGISCCGLTTVWCKRSCFLDKMRIPPVTNWKSCSRQ